MSDLISTRTQGTPTSSPTQIVTSQYDPDITPKARKASHSTISAATFLKSELQRRRSEVNGSCSQPKRPKPCHPQDEVPLSHLNTDGQTIDHCSPNVPERRPSKSKSFVYKTLGIRNSQDNKLSVRRVESMYDTSKDTLLRHFSRAGRSSTSGSLYDASSVSTENEQSNATSHGSKGMQALSIEANSHTSPKGLS